MAGMGYFQTGQVTCHDASGSVIACDETGQDGEFRRGGPWPTSRFEAKGETVKDHLTGLVWYRDANPAQFPLMWQEGLDYVTGLNGTRALGHNDWRLPNRHELRSLICHQSTRPALPVEHPFTNLFAAWYWSSSTATISPAHAWYVHMDGGRMFFGGKDQSFMVWPVRGEGDLVVPITGQLHCYSETGAVISCAGTGQDGELSCGCSWPSPRFAATREGVTDRLTGLCWRRDADLGGPMVWAQALATVSSLNAKPGGFRDWRLPNINEMESLVDCGRHSPALPAGQPFTSIRDVYWSSTTSLYEPDWAWALYLGKGAVGVGQKQQAKFHVWVVRD